MGTTEAAAGTINKSVADAEKINAAIKGAHPIPEAPEPPSDFVELDGGLVFDKETHTSAVVRELNGEHEEALARALKSGNNFHFLNTLLESGTESIGSISDPAQVKKALRQMLIGDRDELALAIRVATYGSELEVLGWVCPHCEQQSDMTFDLVSGGLDIKRKKLGSPDDSRFEVKLRNGARAVVHLAKGEDQLYAWEDSERTSAEVNSRLLSKVVESVVDKNGRNHQILLEPQYVLKLSIPDRRAILKELDARQPGPQYNKIVFRHEECDTDVTIALGLVDLFRDLILFL
jgi:hypothetical protein